MPEAAPSSAPANRVTRWTQKLLDLSLRNRLLNARDSKQLIPIQVDSLGELEDRLSADQSVPIECVDANARSPGSMRTTISPDEMRRRLKELYRVAKTDLEESGVNSLYLALGFLKWRPKGANAKDYRAPLLLMPVQLTRKNVREGYVIARIDEDTMLNATLIEFLRAEYGLAVDGVDPLPEDHSGVAVDEVLQAFRTAVKSMEGWAVEVDAALGNFSFGKFVMWKDLSARADALAAHPLVAHLMKGGGNYDDGIEVFELDELASKLKYGEVYCPLSADSSQLAAVLYSAMGKSFVLHGPPGTGKSQTIANLIAHNLALGRKVLFVSEKKAALDVVHRRLEKIGLKPFCLELHSNKSGKGEVLEQFREALDFVDKGVPNEWTQTAADIEQLRAELNAPMEALHKVWPNGLSAYACFGQKIAGGVEPVAIAAKALEIPVERVGELRNQTAELASAWRATSPAAVAALEPLATFEWNPAAEREAGEALRGLAQAIRDTGRAYVPRGTKPGETRAMSAAELQAAAQAARQLSARPGFLRGIFAFFAGLGKLKVGMEFAPRLEAAQGSIGEARGVMRYRELADGLTKSIGPAFDAALRAGKFSPELAAEAFDRSLAEKTLEEILAREPALAKFSGLAREEQILKFRRLDEQYALLAQHVVRAKLAAAMPSGRLGDCPDGCELGIIRRECAKKTRQKPVRQLLAETRGVVNRLKPCFLMSPLSVSQYLPPEAAFDLVVFDEASQIPVWDAVGVIARAKQCVVVGDPKQMPPTNFFQKGESDADEEESEDLESILDECLAAGLYSAHLNWHYRSRHESLIAFSNHNYYEDKLCTFPAAKSPPSLGVKFHFIAEGVYDAKASRTNRVEAQALVDYVFERLSDPAWKRRSVGVVTFSMAQKNLIEDLFEERREANPKFEDFFSDDGEEPFFVKNLENVQGDERDVILFSVGYARGSDGKFLMNFGPLNRAGGERRLNVAITRAKEQVVVFASCHGAEIDLERTQAVGAAHLRAFLEYAERGGIPNSDDPAQGRHDRFAQMVETFLVDHGYAVERNVGCSGYRIDLGVRDQQSKDAFLAAVECDGASYAASATTRDRDKLRASVLRSLGWNTVRVWSADWALDRQRGEARLLAELEEIKRSPNQLLPEPKFEPQLSFPRKRAAKEVDVPRQELDGVSDDQLRQKMAEIERDLGHCDHDTLMRETVKRFGYKTLSPKARTRLESIRRY